MEFQNEPQPVNSGEARNIAIPPMRMYTPYVYATQQIQDSLLIVDLYILIPVENGKKITFPVEGIGHPSSKEFICPVEPGDANTIVDQTGNRFARKHYQFQVDLTSGIEPNEYELIIKVTDANLNILHKIGLILADADNLGSPVNMDLGGIALDCPYAYMTNIQSTTSIEQRKYHPRLLVPTKRHISSVAEQLVVTSGRVGICESIVLPHGSDDQALHIYMPQNVNQTHFSDLAAVDGSFIAIIKNVATEQDVNNFAELSLVERREFLNANTLLIAVDTNPKKEVVIRPGSADTMPNNLFVDA